MNTKFILDSGDPTEYKTIAKLAVEQGSELWGGTTNPTLIAKKLTGKKVSSEEAFELQKEIIYEIVEIVPGAVSAEVYADLSTKADAMVEQGREIASWHPRVVVKLPTTAEGFKARTELRRLGILTNNTLVFSQEQIYAICLHEHLIQEEKSDTQNADLWPPFISPFVGRLDDIGERGMTLVDHGMTLKNSFSEPLWMLEASVRTPYHLMDGIKLECELITAPASIYEAYFKHQYQEPHTQSELLEPALWKPNDDIKHISSIGEFDTAVENQTLSISHPLTEKGLIRFAQDWQGILK